MPSSSLRPHTAGESGRTECRHRHHQFRKVPRNLWRGVGQKGSRPGRLWNRMVGHQVKLCPNSALTIVVHGTSRMKFLLTLRKKEGGASILNSLEILFILTTIPKYRGEKYRIWKLIKTQWILKKTLAVVSLIRNQVDINFLWLGCCPFIPS